MAAEKSKPLASLAAWIDADVDVDASACADADDGAILVAKMEYLTTELVMLALSLANYWPMRMGSSCYYYYYWHFRVVLLAQRVVMSL